MWSPDSAPGAYSIEYLTTRKYAPIHDLALAGREPHTVVTILLFGWLLFRVHLRRIAIAPPYFKYTHCLDTKEEACKQLGETQDAG